MSKALASFLAASFVGVLFPDSMQDKNEREILANEANFVWVKDALSLASLIIFPIIVISWLGRSHWGAIGNNLNVQNIVIVG